MATFTLDGEKSDTADAASQAGQGVGVRVSVDGRRFDSSIAELMER
jgi:hypothetical protein